MYATYGDDLRRTIPETFRLEDEKRDSVLWVRKLSLS